MHKSPLRSVLLALTAVLLLVSWPAVAANSYKIAFEAGTTDIELEGLHLRIQTTAPVVLTIQIADGNITGTVEGTSSTPASVTVTLLGPPDEIIFRGRIGRGSIFAEYLPQETGQGEM